jgi:hypothetical protein
MTRRIAALFLCAITLAAGLLVPTSAGAPQLPARLSDAEFWRLSESFSEPGGTFHSDNFISNEGRFQVVVPELVSRVTPGGVYLGVGPEQNFTYIAATRPRLVFIIDIRRGNLHEHLLYKALMEMSATRAEFLSRLFSRPRPAGLGPATTVEQLFAAYEAVAPTPERYRDNFQAVTHWLTKQRALPLSAADLDGLDYVYKTAFYREGPELGYALTGAGRMGQVPSYAQLMAMTDDAGVQWSYLSSEERFAFLKGLHANNLIVPVVGNFGGPTALRAVGAYVRSLGVSVSTFYLSNVEQYLQRDGLWAAFCGNVASMPLTASSTFIRSRRGPSTSGRGGINFVSSLGPMQTEVQGCRTGIQ